MESRKHILAIVVAGLSLLLISCSSLLPNMSRNRRKSSSVDEQSLNEQSSFEDSFSSNNYDKTSSQHRHTWSERYVVKENSCFGAV